MQNSRKLRTTPASAVRAGTILLIVLVVVALLALGAYTFAEIMTVENTAAVSFGREVQARALADSGVEYTAALLQKRYLPDSRNYYNDPSTLEGVLLHDAASSRGKGRFSIVTGNEFDSSGRSVRFGISDESSKLNLNTMMKLITGNQIKASDAETMLMAFPNMTQEIADSILDWMDTDDDPTNSGVETSYYQGLSPPYAAKNNFLDSLDELLLVKGVTPDLLFGEDTNHNGILDPNENDGAVSLPLDNADGTLQRGWSAFWTVHSREMNLRSDGLPRTNLNQSDLSNLYSQVLADFDENTAQFILAYRVNGPTTSGGSGGNSGSSGATASAGGNTSSGSNASASSGSGSSGKSSVGGITTNSSSKSSGASSSGSGSSGSSSAGSSGSSKSSSSGSSGSSGSGGKAATTGATLVGGIDISKGASYTIVSLYELPGAQTQAALNGGATQTTLKSPWVATPVDSLAQSVPLIMDKFTLTDNPYIDGRININTAPREVLMSLAGLQGMSETIVDGIYAAQTHNTGSGTTDVPPDRLYTGWLVVNGLLTSINNLENIDPLITGRGDVFHVQSVGYFQGGGPMARVEAVIDASMDPPQVIFMRDLTELGRGFSASLLTTGR